MPSPARSTGTSSGGLLGPGAHRRRDRRRHRHRLDRQVAGRLVHQHRRQLLERDPEAGVVGALVPQRGEPGGGERVVHDEGLHRAAQYRLAWQARSRGGHLGPARGRRRPAGSAAALAAKLRRPDARVLLLDRSDFPRDKACGDGIAAHGRDELAKLGVPDLIADYKPTTKLSVVSPGGATVSATAARPNHVVPRKVFDARLVDAARPRGVEVRRHKVRALTQEAGTVDVDGIRARAVVAADGAGSTVRG
jgi:hypothetical protein